MPAILLLIITFWPDFVFVTIWFASFLVPLVVVVAAAGFATQRATKMMSLITFEPIFIFTISF